MSTKTKGFLDNYKRYDPNVQGYGSIDDWRHGWEQRMGRGEAVLILEADEPLTLLGLELMPKNKMELKNTYRRVIKQNQGSFHLNASVEEQAKAKKIIAAYTVLLAKFE